MHYYPGTYIEQFDPEANAHNEVLEKLMNYPSTDISRIFAALRANLTAFAGDNANDIEVTVTELGPKNSAWELKTDIAVGIFAFESYLTFLEYGATNLDWLELHNGSFLAERDVGVGPAFTGITLAHTLAKPGDEFVSTVSNTVGFTTHAVKRADGSVRFVLVNTGRKALDDVQVTLSGENLATVGMKRVNQRAADTPSGDGTISDAAEVTDLGNDFTINVPAKSVTLLEWPANS